jgi:hypothetical protein
MPPAQLARRWSRRAAVNRTPAVLCQHLRGGGSITLSTRRGSCGAEGSACRCATPTARLPTPSGIAWYSARLVHGARLSPAPHRCYSWFGGRGGGGGGGDGDDDDHGRNVTRFAEQRLKLDTVQADSAWWWQRQRNSVFLAYIVHSNDEFDIEEFTEGAGLVFEALNTAMYCGEPVTEETFKGMVRTRLYIGTSCAAYKCF